MSWKWCYCPSIVLRYSGVGGTCSSVARLAHNRLFHGMISKTKRRDRRPGSQGADIYHLHWSSAPRRGQCKAITLVTKTPDQRWWDSDPTLSRRIDVWSTSTRIYVFWILSWMPCKLRDKNQSVQRLSVNILTRWLLDSDIQILINID